MKCKLLVAEDELIERKVLCRALQKYLGDLICLYEAKNGREALEIFAREAPQVAVLDIEMPGVTGLEVARSIRETDKKCAILFLTGFDKFDYARQAISVRALDYLLKPYNEQELVFAVEDAIRQVSVQLPARPAQPPAPAEPLRREEDEDMRTAIIRAEINRFIDAHYGEDISMQDAAAALRYSDAYFCKLFKQCFKVNFSAYLNEYRADFGPAPEPEGHRCCCGLQRRQLFYKGVQASDWPDPFGIPHGHSRKSGTGINRIYRKHAFFPACQQERNGRFFCFCQFLSSAKRKNCTWIQQRQNRAAFHKIIRFRKNEQFVKL